MTTTQITSIDNDVPIAPPADSKTANLQEQYEWLLERFTDSGWSLTKFRVEQNTHADISDSALEAALAHDSGSVIHMIPFDPQRHIHKTPHYTESRVRLRDNIDNANRYVTISEPVNEWETNGYPADQFVGKQTHPYSNAQSRVSFYKQSAVHSEDEAILESEANGKRGYSMPTGKGTLIAVFGAAQSVTQANTQQTGLESFC
jgi:hypothetical protein